MPCNHVQESRKPGRRTVSARTIDVRSPLARKMVRLVVQFDLAYDQLKRQWQEPGGIPEQEGLALKESARQAVQEFSAFVEEFRAKVEINGFPPGGGRDRP